MSSLKLKKRSCTATSILVKAVQFQIKSTSDLQKKGGERV